MNLNKKAYDKGALGNGNRPDLSSQPVLGLFGSRTMAEECGIAHGNCNATRGDERQPQKEQVGQDAPETSEKQNNSWTTKSLHSQGLLLIASDFQGNLPLRHRCLCGQMAVIRSFDA
ncbi:predicted protein [Coccidioides posadasii str. Silveira]|uniref:Predicted protein n=1 Tax=Coccidioides posadasii (strain RMSCC 757 / Silveira) TaxID=443226 RepID=E9CWL8_COCPS|nr:predicted protein [Coccidioides posadasii str. Silveira]